MCKVEDCESVKIMARGMCNSHYLRWYRYGSALAGGTPNGAPMTFLQDAMTSSTDECILWPYGASNGYGEVLIEGKPTYAHRQVLAMTTKTNPSDMYACHKPIVCHTPLCVNPRHLKWCTPTENAADMVTDGTRANGTGLV